MEHELVQLFQVKMVLQVNWLIQNGLPNFLPRSSMCLVISIPANIVVGAEELNSISQGMMHDVHIS